MSNRVSCEREYLNKAVPPGHFYGVERTVEEQTEDGNVEQRQITQYFHLIGVTCGQSKEKSIHTFQTADDVRLTAPMAWNVQFFERWTPPDRSGEATLVFAESDAEWVLPSRIATFDDLAHRTFRYNTVAPDPDHIGTLVLSDRHRAKPDCAILDATCPAICVRFALLEQGWTPLGAAVDHVHVPLEDQPREFDGRVAVKQKWYYQVLYDLQRCFPLSGGSIPSNEPILFYRLLLRGDRAEAGHSNRSYIVQWNRKRDMDANDLVPLEDIAAPVPIMDGDGESFAAVPFGHREKPKARAREAAPRRGGRGKAEGKGHGGGDPVPDPLPIALPPLPVVPGEADGGEEFAADPAPGNEPPPRDAVEKDFVMVEGNGDFSVSFRVYVDAKTGRPQPHFKLHCRRHGACCEKRRGATPQHERRFGAIEPLAFLHAWHEINFPTKPTFTTHAQENPEKSEVERWATENKDEFLVMLAALGR